jgi:hypothetical protein
MKRVDDKYLLLDEIGDGKYSDVYTALIANSTETVVIKVLKPIR